ncbi:MAG: cytochrome c biogenesis protein CcsA [Bacteroidetes bacterium]|nr:cytochrome c biogenesis protein CcsA [Bacteroidota bacterium]
MNRILNFFFSTRVTLALLLIFAVAIGTATFLEEKYDTITASLLVYQARWFEIVLLLLALNFVGNIQKFKLFSNKKWSILLFHLAFVLLILGAGLTRFVGFEGTMHIRQGETSSVMYSTVPYLQLQAAGDKGTLHYERPLLLSEAVDNDFHINLKPDGAEPIHVKFKSFYSNAVERIIENVEGGTDIVELVFAAGEGQQTLRLTNGETGKTGPVTIAFNNPSDKEALQIRMTEGKLTFDAPFTVTHSDMSGANTDTISGHTVTELVCTGIYHTEGMSFIYKKLYLKAKKQVSKGNDDEKGTEALTLTVDYKGEQKEVTLWGGSGYAAKFQDVSLSNTLHLMLAYGDKEITLPFSLYLDKFILDRYAGSMSPSSFASEVILVDKANNVNEKHRIFMNNVLDYKGYRFFQSSYDTDERGTILSVNHDFWGTMVSYAGYILLGIGFILTLVNRNSRFYALSGLIRGIRDRRKAGAVAMLVCLLGLSGTAFTQNPVQKPVSPEHAAKFGRLLVQTYDGRFEPVNTLAYDVTHKIARKDRFDMPGKGPMNAVQVLIDIMLDGEYWKQQKIIYIREKAVRDVLGLDGKFASLYDLFDQQSHYKLAQYAETSFRKKQSEQNAFDKEIIKLDERVNIFITVLNVSQLKLFPLKDSPNHKWIHPGDSMAFTPLTGDIAILSNELQLKEMTYNNIMQLYFYRLPEAITSGDYSIPDKVVNIIEAIQRQNTPSDILPSKSMVNLEIFYNKAEIFIKLRNWYGILSMVLLTLAFIEVIRSKKSRIIDTALKVFIVLLGLAFLYHTFGLGLRWYLSDHAPWSNGYEALLLMGWGSLLAGFIFARYSRITLAATVLLAFFMLMTASHSSYDPQLTNLQPVLKSYWLIIHVAVITISYGFLGLGFVLGLINLCISLFKTRRNNTKLRLIIRELTYINEMNLTVGLFLATLGTFLGGVWANESWGRYWGWDAKETWALVIVVTYAIILHFRLIPKMKSAYIFNVGSVIGFGSVLMTFIGVNYYLSKGLHSYAADDKAVFPLWAWAMIIGVLIIILIAGVKENMLKEFTTDEKKPSGSQAG